MANSWLSTGGLLFFLRNPMAHPLGSLPPQSRLRTANRHWVCLGGIGRKPVAASRLPSVAEVVTRWMFVSLRVRKRSEPAARVFKNSHEDASLRATGHSRTPTFSACLLKSDNGPSHFKNPIHEPPSAIDVEGEPRPVLPSRTPRKRFISGHELP